MPRTALLGAALAASLIISASPAWAHSHLQASDPAANTTVAASPTAIRLTFSMVVEPKFSTVRVLDANGKVVPTANATPDAQNPKQLVVPLAQALPPGEYKVEWKVVAGDSHPMEGAFTFRIKQ